MRQREHGGSGATGSLEAAAAAAIAAAKTTGLEYYDERPKRALETARREVMFEFRSRWDLNTTWGGKGNLGGTLIWKHGNLEAR